MLYKSGSFELGNLNDNSSKNKQAYINMHVTVQIVQPIKDCKRLAKWLIHAKAHVFKFFFEYSRYSHSPGNHNLELL